MLQQFLRFLLVGGVATLIHYAILFLLHQLLGVNGAVSTSVGFLVSAVFNFLASYHYTFKSSAAKGGAALRYAAVAGLGLLLNGLIFWGLTERLGLYYMVAQVIATGIVLVFNFSAGRAFTFKSSSSPAL
ncbi:MAG: GtrA family protein [Pseudomonadota bacterium]